MSFQYVSSFFFFSFLFLFISTMWSLLFCFAFYSLLQKLLLEYHSRDTTGRPTLEISRVFLAQRESLELNLLALRSKTGIFTLKNQAFWLPQNLKSGNVELQSPMTTLVWIGVIVPLRQNMCLFIHIICQAFWVFGYVIHGTYSAFILSAFLLLA